VFYLLISFLCYLIALNIQDYKFFLTREQISSTLIDIATLSLICTAVAVVFVANYGMAFRVVVIVIALAGWIIDLAVRTHYTIIVYGKLGGPKHEDKPNRVCEGSCY